MHLNIDKEEEIQNSTCLSTFPQQNQFEFLLGHHNLTPIYQNQKKKSSTITTSIGCKTNEICITTLSTKSLALEQISNGRLCTQFTIHFFQWLLDQSKLFQVLPCNFHTCHLKFFLIFSEHQTQIQGPRLPSLNYLPLAQTISDSLQHFIQRGAALSWICHTIALTF